MILKNRPATRHYQGLQKIPLMPSLANTQRLGNGQHDSETNGDQERQCNRKILFVLCFHRAFGRSGHL